MQHIDRTGKRTFICMSVLLIIALIMSGIC